MRYILALLLLFAPPAFACGTDTDCTVGDRSYRISLPANHDGATPIGAVIWSHGYRGSAAGAMRNKSLQRAAHDAGLALIAAQGVNGSWDLPFGPRTFDSTGAAEFAYFDAVIADATARHNIDPERLVATGFSAGGMMVWNLACARPGKFAGFIPISGTFWLKPPETCAAPVSSIIHIHGTTDRTVPLKGRVIRETKQGEVAQALSMYETFGAFGPASETQMDSLTCHNRSNPDGEILNFCLFEGGHSFSVKHLRYGLETLRHAGQI